MPFSSRWILLGAALVVMMVISIYQYSWFLFAFSLNRELALSIADTGLIFSIFAFTATFIQPFSGYIADTYGPRRVAVLAAVFVGLGFVLTSFGSSLVQLGLFYGLGGLGVGVLYGLSTASAVKWFPDKRGFATGLIVFGFGAGTALFNLIIQSLLDSKGTRATFLYIGLAMLIVLVPLAFLYRFPDEIPGGQKKDSRTSNFQGDYKPREMLGTYQWFLMYFCFTFTVSIVLIFGAQMKMLAKEFSIPQSYFSLLLILFPLANGLSRVAAGTISDRIGREKTMVMFYSGLGASILLLVSLGHIPVFFVAFVFISALLGGAPFALYPATIGDYYGAKYSTTNYGLTYTAKAWAGLISGWATAYVAVRFGSYKLPLILVAFLSLAAAVLSHPRWLKPPKRKKGA